MSDQLSRGVPDQWLPENQDDDVKHFIDQTTGEQVSFDDFYGDQEESDGGATRTSRVSRKASSSKGVKKEEANASEGDGK